MRHELLIVDDDPVVLLILEKMVVRSFFHPQPIICQTASEAIQYINQNTSDKLDFLIMLDINMPGMNGWEMMDELFAKSKKPPVKVVIVTSSINKSDRLKAANYPCVVDYIEKPVFVERLLKLKHNESLSNIFG